MNKRKITVLAITLLCGLLMVGGGVWAMSSANYAINWDVIGGGGEPASSANYTARGTIGQPAAESSASTNYKLGSGYWQEIAAPPEGDILAYYRGLGSDPNVVETIDLLQAINDWANGEIPPGFGQAITTMQLLQLINEWASG